MGPNVPVPSKRKDTIWLSSPLDMGKIWVLIWPMMSPEVVTCITITRPLWSGNPLPAVFNTYHAEPMNDVAARPVAPLVWKKGDRLAGVLRQHRVHRVGNVRRVLRLRQANRAVRVVGQFW